MKSTIYRLSSLIVSAVLMLGLLLSPGCTLGNGSPTTTPPDGTVAPPTNTTTTLPPSTSVPPTSTKNYALLFEQVKASVVAVESRTATGTGWVFDASGIIITNFHVIEDSLNASGQMVFAPKITLTDGRIFTASKISGDLRTDLAVVYLANAQNLPVTARGNSAALHIGEPVAAIGHPLGEALSLKGGWVSALNAEIDFSDSPGLYGLIETDAAINPGNSGGPLVNMSGEIIGITSAKLVDVDVEGVGYAISINSALPIINELIKSGVIVRPRLGASPSQTLPSLVSVTIAIANRYGLKVNQGVMVAAITAGGPFEKAGVRAQDVITHFEGTKVNNVEQLLLLLYQKRPGDTVKFTIDRFGTVLDINVTLDLLTDS